ncbi:phage tail assembly chaperone GT [Staphylococcus aureus]
MMDLIENGKDANQVLKMPFHYVLSIYQNKNNGIEEKAEALIYVF